MKKTILLLAILILVMSCKDNAESKDNSKPQDKTSTLNDEAQTEISSDDLEKSMEQLGGLFGEGKTAESNDNVDDVESTFNQLGKLLEMGGLDSNDFIVDSTQLKGFSTEAILDMLEKSGVSRKDMEKLLNNPDSLKILAQEAIKNRQIEEQNTPKFKGKLSKQQLTTINPTTGVSLEEAILLVQAESGPEATMEKLKLIDSLAGTDMMSQLNLKEGQQVFNDVERKNEPKASAEEEKEMEALRKLSSQMHSDKEATKLLAELTKKEQEIASGKLKASPKYERAITYRKNIVKTFQNQIARKAIVAKKKFKQLNPDLYYGDDVGVTYVGHQKKAVYLPLGSLSFADKVVEVHHPKLLTQQVNNVLGEPDVIEGFLPEDISGIHSLGLAGTLTIQFIDNALTNVNGPDLYIFEIGKIEPTNLEISKDGIEWIKVGKIDGGVAEVDIGPFVKNGELFYYVRLKDLKEESALPGADVDAIAAIGAAMRLNLDSQVLFDSGKSELKLEGIEALKELVNSITVLKKGKVIVEGHTDDIGSESTNNALSLARAKSVSKALRQLIPSTEFKWQEKGYGESKPLVKNDAEENRSKNRRVEILVVPN